MSMKQLYTVTLNAKQIREACEAQVAKRIDQETEEARATVPDDLKVEIVVTNKYVRKSRKTTAKPAFDASSEARR